MRPKKPGTMGEGDLFRARLEQIINLKHELVQLGGKIDWDWIDDEIAPLYSDRGRPAIETRFVIGLLPAMLAFMLLYYRRAGLIAGIALMDAMAMAAAGAPPAVELLKCS